MRSADKPLVVRDESMEVVSEIDRSRKMQRIKTAQLRWIEDGCALQSRLCHTDECHRAEQVLGASREFGRVATYSSHDLKTRDVR